MQSIDLNFEIYWRNYMELRNKKVLVVGLGRSGLAAAVLLKNLGALPRVTDNEKSESTEKNAAELSVLGIPYELGSHADDFLEGSELVVVSPGVPDESPAVKWAQDKKIPIIGEVELAYSVSPAPIIAITGTNGKSTVTMLTGKLLSESGKKAVVCGNIGNPFSGEVANLEEDSIVVLEISSFQLERIKTFKPRIVSFLNMTQDHFDRYPNIEQYFNAKKRIFMSQNDGDYAILNYDSQKVRALSKDTKAKALYFTSHRLPKEYDGAYIENKQIIIRTNGKFQWVANVEDLGLEGTHNIHNYLASILAAFTFGAEPASMEKTLHNFKTLPHRFETVGVVKGVRFIDDSKATNVDSVARALDCCTAPVMLIAGGRDKASDFRPLKELVKKKVKGLFLLGEAKEKIASTMGKAKQVHFADSMDQAVKAAFKSAAKGDIVLLSPICASFDMFKDYKERGEVFRKAVKELG